MLVFSIISPGFSSLPVNNVSSTHMVYVSCAVPWSLLPGQIYGKTTEQTHSAFLRLELPNDGNEVTSLVSSAVGFFRYMQPNASDLYSNFPPLGAVPGQVLPYFKHSPSLIHDVARISRGDDTLLITNCASFMAPPIFEGCTHTTEPFNCFSYNEILHNRSDDSLTFVNKPTGVFRTAPPCEMKSSTAVFTQCPPPHFRRVA